MNNMSNSDAYDYLEELKNQLMMEQSKYQHQQKVNVNTLKNKTKNAFKDFHSITGNDIEFIHCHPLLRDANILVGDFSINLNVENRGRQHDLFGTSSEITISMTHNMGANGFSMYDYVNTLKEKSVRVVDIIVVQFGEAEFDDEGDLMKKEMYLVIEDYAFEKVNIEMGGQYTITLNFNKWFMLEFPTEDGQCFNPSK